MRLIVEGVSKFGFLSGGVWYNPDREKKPSFFGLNKGDEVEVTANGKWVQSIEVVTTGNKVATSSPKQPQEGPKQPPKHAPEVQSQICRGNACNAVFGSPAVANLIKDSDVSEGFATMSNMVDKVANYIATGSWVKGE